MTPEPVDTVVGRLFVDPRDRALTLLIEVWPEGLTNCGPSLDELLRKGEVVMDAHTYDWMRRRAARLDTPQSTFNAVFVRVANCSGYLEPALGLEPRTC